MRTASHTNPTARLRSVALFSDCDDAELRRIDHLVTLVPVTAGTVLMREGRVGRECLVIAEGFAVAHRPAGRRIFLGPGAVVGEMALLGGRRRSATVIAVTPMQVYVLDPREFAGLLDVAPSVRRKVLAAARRRGETGGGAPETGKGD